MLLIIMAIGRFIIVFLIQGLMSFNLLSFVLIIPLFISCSNQHQGSIEDRLQHILDKKITAHGARGVSASVIFPDGKIWTGTSGISHDTVKIKPDMLFAIGSVTKNVVSALTLKLVEEGILSLEDPLSKWLPDYPFIDNKITIRQLLNHTSGIYMFWENQKIWDDLKEDRTKSWTQEEVLAYIKEPDFEPGEGLRYSNTNYLLLGMIIEKVTSSNLSTLFRKYFWEPLRLDNVYVIEMDSIPDNLAHVYGDNFIPGNKEIDLTYKPRTSHETITFASSGIFTTAESLARWSHALFEGEVLADRSMVEMLQFVEFNPFSNMMAYGLGVQLFEKRFSHGKDAIGHGGGNIGTTTYMIYLPDYHISIVVMVNAFPNKTASVITKAMIKETLKEINAIGIIPYIEFFPTGFLILCIVSILSMITFSIIKKRQSRSS
jgi:D-alanyl-D-alanine carboxypeptidase